MEQEEAREEEPVSFWQVFFDDVYLLFFLGAAIFLLLYTVWGLVELGSVATSPLVKG
ncbi:MAG: hypothetical protein ACNS63_07525 [Candidatus Nitrospinota bacterium M3_3B_026]